MLLWPVERIPRTPGYRLHTITSLGKTILQSTSSMPKSEKSKTTIAAGENFNVVSQKAKRQSTFKNLNLIVNVQPISRNRQA